MQKQTNKQKINSGKNKGNKWQIFIQRIPCNRG